MSADKRENCRFLNTWQHMGWRKVLRRMKKGAALLAAGCMILSSMDLTAWAADRGQAVDGVISMAEGGDILGTVGIAGGGR